MRRMALLLLAGLTGCGFYPRFPGSHQVWVGDRSVIVEDEAEPTRSLSQVHMGEPGWTLGVPRSPTLDLISVRSQDLHLGFFSVYTLGGIPFHGQLTRILRHRQPDGSWRRVGQYRSSQDPHGRPALLVPLGDGSFLALAEGDWFQGDGQASPCARYALDAQGELCFHALVNPMEGVSLPPRKPEPDATSPWLPWYDKLEWAAGPRAVVIASSFGGCLSLLDRRDGHLLRHVQLPAKAHQAYYSLQVQPAPDGSFRVTAARAAEHQDAVRTPGGNLAAARLGLIQEDVEVRPVAFRLDPASGELKPQALPAGTPSLISHAEYNYALTFLVDAQGQLELHRREMR